MRTVIYVIEQPLSKWNYDRFGIQVWIDNGWNVKVWDLTQLLNPNIWDNFIQSGSVLYEFNGYYQIRDKTDLERRYNTLQGGEYYISAFGEDRPHFRIMMQLSRLGALRIHQYLGCVPTHELASSIGRFISRVFRLANLDLTKLFERLLSKIRHIVFGAHIKPRLVVISGQKSIPAFVSAGDASVVLAHNLDYDVYLRIRDGCNNKKNGHVLFIDQNLCFHTDWAFAGEESCVSPKRYFPEIRVALQSISLAFQAPILVAAHPRFDSAQVQEHFHGISVEYGITAELIRDCKVVVGHDSTALQLAVLFGKPIIFLTTSEMEDTAMAASIRYVASELGKTAITIDQNINVLDWQRELSIDSIKYAAYKRKYIKMDGSPDIPIWEIVIEHIENSARKIISLDA
jgi:hypothetical protein